MGNVKIKRRIPAYLLIFALAAGLALSYVFWIRKDMSDFGVCFQGGKRILRGETLYRVEDGHLQFKYSPLAAVFFSAFTPLSFEGAKVMWFILELIFFVGALSLSLGFLQVRGRIRVWLAVAGFLVTARFLGRELELGQVNLLILFLLTAGLFFFLGRKEAGAGLLWGATLFFKPYVLVLVPYLLIKKKWKTLLVGLALSISGLAVPALFYGPKGNFRVLREWWNSLSQSTPSLLVSYDNSSLLAFILKLFPTGSYLMPQFIFLLAVIILAFCFLWMMRRGRSVQSDAPEILEAAFLFILIPFLSPLGWYYNYLYSLLGILLLLHSIKKFRPGLRTLLIVNFILIGASVREVLGKEVYRFWTGCSIVSLNYLLALFYLAYLRAKEYA